MSSNGTSNERPREEGFEYHGTFYRFDMKLTGKDLLLIDRIAGLPLQEFFEAMGDDFERARTPIFLTMVATAMRSHHPDWSVERIVRTVMDLDVSELTVISGDAEEETLPPAPEDETTASTGASSSSESKSPSSATSPAPSARSNAIPA